MIVVGIVLSILIIVAAGALLFGAQRWNAGTEALRASLDAARVGPRPQTVDFRELEGLPPPVQRYFRAVLKEGQPMVTGVAIHHKGTFNMGEAADQWKPFRSDQKVVTQRPGFDWDARIAIMPGMPVRVHDAYVAGEGLLHASWLGLFSLADLRGAGDVAQGELMRFFAETAWYPTALLPSQGVRWQPAERRSAYATLTEGAISTTLLFTFSEQGPIDTVYADRRSRMVGGRVIATPWRGRFWNDAERGGMRVPLDGQVAWVLAEGTRPYWRGHIVDIEYEFAR